jgi:aspartyl protease family protein
MAGGTQKRLWGLLVGGLVVVGLSFALFEFLPDVLPEGHKPRFYYLTALLALLLASLFGRLAMAPRSTLRWALGTVAAWLGIGLFLVLGFSYRAELNGTAQRVLGRLIPTGDHSVIVVSAVPARPATNSLPDMARDGRSMRFTMEQDGQFHVDALIGATAVRFILDTGASEVMLSLADARRLGYDTSGLSYTRLYRTANGTVRAAALTLPAIDIGPIRIVDVDASVLDTDAESSLLGMSFLKRLSSYRVEGPTLTLTQ